MMTGDDGLTLIEMLAVLAILGVAAGAAALSLAPARGGGIAAEATGLARDLTRAADATLAGAPPAVLVVDGRGYAIDGRRHDLPGDTRLAGVAPGTIAGGESAPFNLSLARRGENWRVDFDGLRATARAVAAQ